MKTERFNLRMTKQEKEKIRKKAEKAHKPMAEFMIDMALEREIVVIEGLPRFRMRQQQNLFRKRLVFQRRKGNLRIQQCHRHCQNIRILSEQFFLLLSNAAPGRSL